MQTVGDMTFDELKQFVQETVDAQLMRMLGSFEIPDTDDESAAMTWDEIRASVDEHRWTPPEGAKTSLQLLREGATSLLLVRADHARDDDMTA